MATATVKPKAKKARSTPKQRFDGENSNHWHEIPSKQQLFMLAIAAFNGANFEGAALLRSRAEAKALISELKEDGILD